MNAVCYDANGDRIKTDILVAGYVRHGANEFHMDIPDDIIKLCFLFWLLTVCDEWDKSMKHPSHEAMKIDGDIFRWKDGYERGKDNVYTVMAYGKKSVEDGLFEWRLSLKTDIKFVWIRMVPDEPDILMQSSNSERRKRGECFLFGYNGCIFYYGENKLYCPPFSSNEDNIIKVTLDMDNHAVSFEINDKDYGIAYDKLFASKYRLGVTLGHQTDKIEFI